MMSYEKITVPDIGKITKICPIIDDGKHQLLDIFEDEQGNLYLFNHSCVGRPGKQYATFIAPIKEQDIISFLDNSISEGELWLKTEGLIHTCTHLLWENADSWEERWKTSDKESWWDDNKHHFLSGGVGMEIWPIYLSPDDGEFDDEINFFTERQYKHFKGITLDDYLDTKTKENKKMVLYRRDRENFMSFYKKVKDEAEAYKEIEKYIDEKIEDPEIETIDIKVSKNANAKFFDVYSELASFILAEEDVYPAYGQVGKGE